MVSGGHTQLVSVASIGDYDLLGEFLDVAEGESGDMTAKMGDLGYRGGRCLAELAEKGERERFTFPRPVTDRAGLDFSFAG